MDGRGWGLTLESSSSSSLDHHHHNNTRLFTSSSAHNNNNHKQQHLNTMTNNNKTNNTMFPLNLHCREINDNQDRDNDGDRRHLNNKMVAGEVDFFSDHRKKMMMIQSSNNNNNNSILGSATMVLHQQQQREEDNNCVKQENSADHRTSQIDVNTGLHLLTTNTGSDQSIVDDGTSSDREDKKNKNELLELQSELQRMNTENEKLKSMLTQMGSNYNYLQSHLLNLMQQQQQQLVKSETKKNEVILEEKTEEKHIVPRQFLDLGPSANTQANEHKSLTFSDEDRPQNYSSPTQNTLANNNSHGKRIREESPENSETQSWVQNKVPKLNHNNINIVKSNGSPIDQATAEATMRKARVSVRARSEAPMISDGCQWRKYGQKMAKGNPCPRAYYRCTMAAGCPVRKQVQRCAEDRSILITTYEGNHNHPLPPAAMAMASTTSSAASMLLSGSMPSGDGLMNPNFLARTILPCSSSMATISASAPFPTVTLDLTHSPNSLQTRPSLPQSTPPFQVPFPPSTTQVGPNFLGAIPQLLGQAFLNNNNNNNNTNQSVFSGLQTSSSHTLDATHLQLPNQNAAFSDTLSAATAAIASDPNFTAALAAAISSIINGGRPSAENNNVANNAPESSPSGATTSGNNANNATSSGSLQQQ